MADPGEQASEDASEGLGEGAATSGVREPSLDDQAALGHYRAAQEGITSLLSALESDMERQGELIGSLNSQYDEAIAQVVKGHMEALVSGLESGEISRDQCTAAVSSAMEAIKSDAHDAQVDVLGADVSQKMDQLKAELDEVKKQKAEEFITPISEFVSYITYERGLVSEEEADGYFQGLSKPLGV